MGESDEEWWEKDIESFTRELQLESGDDKFEKLENVSQKAIDKERLYNLMKEGESLGNSSKTKEEVKGNTKLKIHLNKLLGISKMTSLKAFTELNNLRAEFLETIKSTSLSKNLLVVACLALFRTFETPFEEHKYVLMRDIKDITSFWMQVSKNVAEVTETFQHGLVSVAKVLMRFSDLSVKVRDILKVIAATEMKRPGADLAFWEKFVSFLETSGSETVSKVSGTILPTTEDLLEEPKEEISENIVKGAFPSVTEYRQTHMSLLKEDFLAPIRQSLALYNENSPEGTYEGRIDQIYVIPRVQLGYGYSETVREFVDLKFNENPSRKKSIKAKRFIPGTLLIFASDVKTLRDLMLGIVLPYEDDLLKQGIVPLTIVKSRAEHKIFDGQLTLIEPTTFFDPYHHVYNVLANSTEPEIPMKNYLVEVSKKVQTPGYLSRIKNPNIKVKGQLFSITDPSTYPEGVKLGLDDTQMAAYKAALTQEFALIQGPPGTGKTHIGLEILSTLLQNTKEKVLIVCYTNHALDQTLTGLLPETDLIVRFGEQSKSEVMQKYTFRRVGLDRNHLEDLALKQLYWKTKQEMFKLSDQFVRLQVQEEVVEQAVLEKLQLEMLSVKERVFELSQLKTFLRIQDKRVFGMTTSYAARCHVLLQLLGIPIVVIEEAAQILESHVVTALTPKTEHLILIGDHMQLKPDTSTYHLAQYFHMNISLFERMVNNKIPHVTLRNQHRMRPVIAEQIRDTIYPNLDDAPNVLTYPDVKGMSKNMYFWTHDHPESAKKEDQFNETSKTNKFEADSLISLCEYLIKEGNAPGDITILTMYNGQRKLLQDTVFQRGSLEALRGVNITVVDNFQGEENKIILLSLVRSNDKKQIGFVGIPNRVCVALSRAKEGMYIIGNMKMLKESSSIWKKINEKLEKSEAIGDDIRKVMVGELGE